MSDLKQRVERARAVAREAARRRVHAVPERWLKKADEAWKEFDREACEEACDRVERHLAALKRILTDLKTADHQIGLELERRSESMKDSIRYLRMKLEEPVAG
jgi:hypothetical protein